VRRSELELSINWVRRLLPKDDQIVVSASLGALGYGGVHDAAYRAVLLVERPAEIRTFQQ
jgi:hypothetical protein